MALSQQLVDALIAAGFQRVVYTEHALNQDLNFFNKTLPCRALQVLGRSDECDEAFSGEETVVVEVIGDYDQIQLVVSGIDYVINHIALDDELGKEILTDCGVSLPVEEHTVLDLPSSCAEK